MRKPRLTWKGAYHHVMNRGINGLMIFEKSCFKKKFHSYIEEYSKQFHIDVYAYCIMNNHYHMVIQNSSGMMSRFMQSVNGSFGTFYRRMTNSKGYVFQGRYKSTLIENDSYLIQSIIYTLLNPLRANLVSNALDYPWASGKLYFGKSKKSFLDIEFVNHLYQTQKNFDDLLSSESFKTINVASTKFGEILGSDELIISLTSKKSVLSAKSAFVGNNEFAIPQNVICNFEKKFGIKMENIDTSCKQGKKLRLILLKLLRETCMMKYSEISKINLFSNLRENSLRNLYKKSKDL